MKIAVYAIAKNEEQYIERWASSCEDADFRFILDTGSTDKTIEIATGLGVSVVSAHIEPWRFDDARNTCLALLPKDIDICIALDIDEVLTTGWRKELEKINKNTTRPLHVSSWLTESNEVVIAPSSGKIHRRYGYRWKGPIYETLVTNQSEEIQEIVDLEIRRFPRPSKNLEQNIDLLKLSLIEDPMNSKNTYYLAKEYFSRNKLQEAAEIFKSYLKLPGSILSAEKSIVLRYLAKCEPENAETYLNEAIEAASDRREALVDLALYFYEQKRWGPCFFRIKQALRIKNKILDGLSEEYAWGPLPWDIAAISAYHEQDYSSAAAYGYRALELDPTNERLKKNLELYRSMFH